MSHDQKPARIRVVGGTAPDRQRSAGPALSGGFATGPAPRRAKPRQARKPGLARTTIAFLFLSAALIGGAVQAWLLLRA
ncbi:hypothetical protein K9B35_13495 [Sphingomonas sp. R647]|uniref:hypothetical protein n=1 Tax=Sphingomonas sp. R647 TaxID=2875233 RepID=UPI001CD44690|nr:hypothetical protein [Sphingomonas sp. R647]MCA1198986.1 hypothetical protein [Sphingomonas sp. R647]